MPDNSQAREIHQPPDARAAATPSAACDTLPRTELLSSGSDFAAGPPGPEVAGATVGGRYLLLERIGEGGMGTVWLAEQRVPLQRQVALKLIKPGMDSAQVLARFEAERQALAIMDHPHIAKVLDGGSTELGRPFFAMELVKGISLTAYCDAKRLPIRERLEIFVSICQAVQHAHQKGVIHRDLKPGNVLVAEQEGRTVPKVIDFGLVKALVGSHVLTDRTLNTFLGSAVGTPLYMAPEQLGVDAADVDTRADVYALGVILYELLTGTTPIERDRFSKDRWEEFQRIVREEEPPRPSARISSNAAISSLAERRGTSAAQLKRFVAGELDWISLKALEKDRDRRYETANGLAMDVQRYLRDEPVLACPPSRVYRWKKFLRRNRAAVATTALVGIALLGGVIGTTWGMVHARISESRAVADRARAEANFERARQAVDGVVRRAADVRLRLVPGMESVRREMLEEVAQFYEDYLQRYTNDPAFALEAARGNVSLARVYGELGRDEDATKAFEGSIAMLRRQLAAAPGDSGLSAELAIVLTEFGQHLLQHGRIERAVRTTDEAVSQLRTALRQSSEQANLQVALAAAIQTLGLAAQDSSKHTLAIEHHREAVHLLELAADRAPSELEVSRKLGAGLQSLGILLRLTGDLDGAEEALRTALVHSEPSSPLDRSPELRAFQANVLAELSTILVMTSRSDEGERLLQESIDCSEQLVSDYPMVPSFQHTLASQLDNQALWLMARLDHHGAEPLVLRALPIHQRLADAYPHVPQYRNTLAGSQYRLGAIYLLFERFADAAERLRTSIALMKQLTDQYPENAEYRLQLTTSRGTMARVLYGLGELDEAERELREGLKVLDELAGDSSRLTIVDMNRATFAMILAELLQQRGANKETRELLLLEVQCLLRYVDANRRAPLAVAQLDSALERFTTSALEAGDVAAAVDRLEELAAPHPEFGEASYAIAVQIARCVEAANRDESPPPAKRAELASGFAARAVAILRKAVETGAKQPADLANDPKLAALREHPEFLGLIGGEPLRGDNGP